MRYQISYIYIYTCLFQIFFTLSSYFDCFVYCCCFTRFHGRGSCMLFGAVADLDQTGIAGSIMSLLCTDMSGFVAVVSECLPGLNVYIVESEPYTYQNNSKH